MDAKILDFMHKGKTTLARVEVDNGTDKIVIPVVLEEGMTEADFLIEAKKQAIGRFSSINNPKPVIIPEDIETLISEARAKVAELRAELDTKINQKIRLE